MTRAVARSIPTDVFLDKDLIPSFWCSGCGIGTVVNNFLQTVERLKLAPNKLCVISGNGCTGRIAQHLNCKTFQITDSDAMTFAMHQKLENPDMKIVVFLSDADFIGSGANGLVSAGKKGSELLLVYINNFIYHVFIEHRMLLNTPFLGNPADNQIVSPFNIPHLAKSCGAHYIARWTPLHVRRLMYAMTDALKKTGLSVVEVINPCLMYYASNGNLGKTIDRMKFFLEQTTIRNNEPTENLDLRSPNKIIVGRFFDQP